MNVALTAPRADYRGPKMGTGDDDIKVELLPAYNFSYEGNAILCTKEGENYTEFQLNSAANYARFHLVTLLEKHRMSGNTAPMKNIILGCTHYPFLLDTLVKAVEELREYKVNGQRVYADLLAEDVEFIDPALFTAIECYQTLRAEKNLAEKTHTATSYEEFIDVAENKPGFIRAMWCGEAECEEKLKEETGGVKSRCIPFNEEKLGDVCVCCGKPARHMVVWGRQY